MMLNFNEHQAYTPPMKEGNFGHISRARIVAPIVPGFFELPLSYV